MILRSKIIEIRHRERTSTFFKVNREFYLDHTARIGSSTSAVAKMLENDAELKVLMPNILGLSPNTSTTDWDKAVKNYWDSLSVAVPELGKKLEIGWKIDINNESKIKAIENLQKNKNSIKTEEDLADYVCNECKEEYKYKYATPIVPKEYLWWRYCLNYNRVANDIKDVEASPKIKFYLISEEVIANAKKKRYDLNRKSMEVFMKLITKPEDVDNVIYILRNNIEGNILTMTEDEKHMALETIHTTNPELLIKTATDKNLNDKATVERFVLYNLWKRLDGTDIIVDSNNAAVIIGNTVEEAISFMNNPAKKEPMNVYTTKLKSIIKSKTDAE